jgi:hypothetical protein
VRNAKLEHTVNYRAAQASMRIIELENVVRLSATETIRTAPPRSERHAVFRHGRLVKR